MAKKDSVLQDAGTMESKAISEARELIKARLPEPIDGCWVFKLKTGVAWMFPPKFTYYSKTTNGRVNVRYVETENSIFEPEQSGEDVLLEQMEVSQHYVVRDRLRAEWLVLNPNFGIRYDVHDPEGEANRAYAKMEQIDSVWDSVKGKTDEQKRTLAVMLTKRPMADINRLSEIQLKLLLKHECETAPAKVGDVVQDPLIDTLYIVAMADALKEIKYNKHTGGLVWADTNREICKIPSGKDPIMHLARLLLEDEYLKVREELEKRTLE